MLLVLTVISNIDDGYQFVDGSRGQVEEMLTFQKKYFGGGQPPG